MSGSFDEIIEKVIAAIESGDFQKAADGAKKCIELDRKNPEGHFFLGEALAGLEMPKEAIAAYEAGLKLAPEDTDALTCLGDIYFEQGQHKDALKLYEKIVKIDPKDADGYVNIGLVYNSMERAEDAIKAYDTGAETRSGKCLCL